MHVHVLYTCAIHFCVKGLERQTVLLSREDNSLLKRIIVSDVFMYNIYTHLVVDGVREGQERQQWRREERREEE